MGRKKILDVNTCKFTLNVNGENKQILDTLTDNYMMKYGPMLNLIIATFCRMPDDIKKTIEKTCIAEYKRIENEIALTEEYSYHRKSLLDDKNNYMNILRLINSGIFQETQTDEKEVKLRKYKLQDGYLVAPENWIVVNPEQALSMRYAAVLECRNSTKYDIPHFVYFTNYKHRCDYSEAMEYDFLSSCEKIWPRFKDIKKLSDQNQLIPDPENPGQYINSEAHLNAPIIGFFSIEEQGISSYDSYPYGAMIVRTNLKDE